MLKRRIAGKWSTGLGLMVGLGSLIRLSEISILWEIWYLQHLREYRSGNMSVSRWWYLESCELSLRHDQRRTCSSSEKKWKIKLCLSDPTTEDLKEKTFCLSQTWTFMLNTKELQGFLSSENKCLIVIWVMVEERKKDCNYCQRRI